MNKYECLYVIVPELNEEETKSVIEKFNGVITANGGMIENVDEWGKRRLQDRRLLCSRCVRRTRRAARRT